MKTPKIDRNGSLTIPAMLMPGFRSSVAIDSGVERNLLFRTWGGLGDQICAEPTLRYALKKFKDCRISLESECPELFWHLDFDRVFDAKKERPIYENYLVFETIVPPNDTNMVWQFFCHLLTNCVDFPSLCALRSQLPIEDRNIVQDHSETKFSINFDSAVAVHAGRHWTSKTFPKDWWDSILFELKSHGATPVLIGANTDDNRGTVDVETAGCIDMRNQLSVSNSISLLRQSKVLLTNDSAPLHMAVPGNAWIGYVATCKHPDMITHWRRNQSGENEWSWRMKNHGKGGIWDLVDYCPNKSDTVTVEDVEESVLRGWLPDAKDFASWAAEKLNA